MQDTQYQEINTDELNNGQKQAYDLAVLPLSNSEQVFLLVCGGPGTGKTFTANTIIKNLASQIIQTRACSFMWNAVFQLDVECPKPSIYNLLGGN